ncbi:hypothetical protein PY093_03500 [Cytobacillus sp. S13-E01]|uniref:DUF6843 domain-containing protein n=1 Tax=Cytobacillus sp. S13-E01 TaxID=3031326 RepID=UPI0023D7FFAA|nr:hypothetical protein [Cytobacillus sp. S13-E01]MDF0725778.1 hypothetical protein [Cytobacillus sp. S13-E01]
MKKITIVLLSAILLGGAYYMFFAKKTANDEEFALPEGYQGCAHVVYNVKNAPPLKVTDGKIVHTFDENGISLTSSPEDFGWEGEEFSGFYNATYYYVDKQGNKTSEIEQEQIFNSGLGSLEEDGKVQITHYHFSVKDKNASCEKDLERVKKLINK